MADAFHIETAGGNVGGHQDVDLARFQARHGALPQGLWDVAVERRRREAARLEFLREFHRRVLGAGEHQHAVKGFGLENARQCIELVHAADHPVAVSNVGRRAGLASDGDFNGRMQVLLRNAANRGRNGCGEQSDLALRRRLFKDAFHGIDKAHAQHLIRLIQHQQGQTASFRVPRFM